MKTPDFEMFAYSSSFSQKKKKKTCADQIKHFYQTLYSLGSPIFNLWLEYLFTYLAGIADQKATVYT